MNGTGGVWMLKSLDTEGSGCCTKWILRCVKFQCAKVAIYELQCSGVAVCGRCGV